MTMSIFIIACLVLVYRLIDLGGFAELGECRVLIGKKGIGFLRLFFVGTQRVVFSRCSQAGVCLRVENA